MLVTLKNYILSVIWIFIHCVWNGSSTFFTTTLLTFLEDLSSAKHGGSIHAFNPITQGIEEFEVQSIHAYTVGLSQKHNGLI